MKKCVLVGSGDRAWAMFARPIKERFADLVEVMGIYDVNPLRAERVKSGAGLACGVYTDFDRMLRETKPDFAAITTVDRFHHEYIIRSLEAGLDAITEKPMTIDAEKCRAILEAERRTGKKVIVTFNYRFVPYVTRIKELIREGAIGTILNVDFEYLLDTNHGGSYFRRWHRRKENSGGLLVHKATHHFDVINWWLEEEPQTVMGFGSRRFFAPDRQPHGERCLTCDYKQTCEYYTDITVADSMGRFYYDYEKADNYAYDRCPFGEDADIEDTMSVNVKYSGGALLSYSLIAHSPYEGWKASINGALGRLEAAEYHSGLRAREPNNVIELYNRHGEKLEITVPKASGGHGGGDERLQRMLFMPGQPDPLHHMASSYDGAISILIGIAANVSIREGRAIRIRDLVPLERF